MASAPGSRGYQEMALSSESQREREFYRYFEPIEQWTAGGPPFCDLNSNVAVNAHTPIASPDSALTAFCQLGALRCGTRRAMLLFFDKQYAYVLAEATRSLSLLDASIQDDADNIWLGHSKIPRGYSVCEKTTIHLPPLHDGQDIAGDGRDVVHIVNDLRADTTFCDQPFVTGGPRARFYAGVPITTARGINIGAYCLLDDKPRDGLNENELKFLRHMSSTVMKHLEMVRAKSQAEHASRMVAGLGAFVDATAALGDVTEERDPSPEAKKARSPQRESAQRTSRVSSDGLRSPGQRGSLDAGEGTGTNASAVTSPKYSPSEDSGGATASRRANDLRAELVSSKVRNTFEHAAGTLRDAVQLDGAMFIDASPSSYGGLVDGFADADGFDKPPTSSDTGLSSPESGAVKRSGSGANSSDEGGSRAVCNILASSYRKDPRHPRSDAATQMDERFLRKLLHRYPKGKIWNFSAEGVSSSDDEQDNRTKATNVPSASPPGVLSRRKKRRKASRLDDGKRLARYFPGVRSLAISGIVNQVTGRWHAASVVWTYSDYRALTEELDMPFLQAFSDVLMAEVHRIEAQRSDRAKVDFISSISHELRSPLHGILGSVECIQEQELDGCTSDLVSQIEACGRTLLDIVEHLLDHSKINYYGRATNKRLQKERKNSLPLAGKTPLLGNTATLDTEVDLGIVTEEVVDATYYSYCCSRKKQEMLKRKVALVLDIERGVDSHWWCRIPLGAWKRIVLNLVGNALKYTDEGHVQVSLKRDLGPRRKRSATLVVRDTGCGMSKAFLQDRLFSAFAQEDSFAEGTGLGMNLVASIVKALGGKIEVQSEQHVGTSVTVQIPLERFDPRDRRHDEMQTHAARAVPSGTIIGMATSSFDAADASTTRQTRETAKPAPPALMLGSIVKTCSEMGVQTVNLAQADSNPDIIFATEDQASQYEPSSREELNDQQTRSRAHLPLILLFDNAMRLREFRASHKHLLDSRHVELVSQPAGPERLCKAMQKCLASRNLPPTRDAQPGAEQRESATKESGNTPAAEWQDVVPLRTPEPDIPAPTKMKDSAIALSSSTITRPQAATSRTLSQVTIPPSASALSDPSGAATTTTTSTTSTTTPTTPPPPSSGLTILLVDDNPINLQLLTTYATKHGHAHIRAHNGQHALDAYRAACTRTPLPPDIAALQPSPSPAQTVVVVPSKPDVVLMDINMPVLNGYEATRAIRAFERSAGLEPTKVVALTGLGSAGAQQEAYASGVDLFLTKPVRLRELGKVLEGARQAGN